MTAPALARGQTEPKRDQYGRYLLPDPETGREQAWTRVTTIAGTLADRFGLEQWSKRNVILGLAARRDLYALAASCSPEDKEQLNRIVKDAEEAAKARSGANLGTALHRITERIDSGEELDVPEPWRADVDVYLQTLLSHRVTIQTEYLERIVIHAKTRVAGTLDRLVTVNPSDELFVADLKTGRDIVTYGMGDIAIQLALYASATHMWNGSSYDPMPAVNQERAIAIHLPVGEGKCTLYWVDIKAGAAAAKIAFNVRKWRGRKDLAEVVNTWQPKGSTEKPIQAMQAEAAHAKEANSPTKATNYEW